MMPPDLQPWQRKALRSCWQHSKWAIKYADMGMPDAARDATIQAVRFYHYAFPWTSEGLASQFEAYKAHELPTSIGVSYA